MRLSQRTLFLVLLPTIIFAILLTTINHVTHSEHIHEITIHKVKLLSQVSAYEMVNPMYNLDVDKLNEIIDGVEEQDEVIQVLVLHPDGRVLTDGTDESPNYGNILHNDSITDTSTEQIFILDNSIRLFTPIVLNEHIGTIMLDYSLESANAHIMQSVNIAIIITAILLSAFIVVAIYFSRSITKPILEIRDSIDKIAEGEYTQNQKKIGIPEIQKLNERIDEMYKKLTFYQNELSKTERLATIGELSARIAHDLRNPLTTIQNSIELLKIKNPDIIKENTEYFDYIDVSINKINIEINGVLNHTKIRPLEKSVTKFSKILDHALTSLEIPKNIKIIRPNKDAGIFADAKQLENVFSNLIGNAVDAVDKNSGIITINLEEDEQFHKNFCVR